MRWLLFLLFSLIIINIIDMLSWIIFCHVLVSLVLIANLLCAFAVIYGPLLYCVCNVYMTMWKRSMHKFKMSLCQYLLGICHSIVSNAILIAKCSILTSYLHMPHMKLRDRGREIDRWQQLTSNESSFWLTKLKQRWIEQQQLCYSDALSLSVEKKK